jgi:hypothetical protein
VTLVVAGDVVYCNVQQLLVKRVNEAVRRLLGSFKINGV